MLKRVNKMNQTTEISFAEVKQERARRTLDDLINAALDLVEIGDPNMLTSRTLADKAGYGLGTLNKRLTSIDKVFLWAIKKHQLRHLNSMSESIKNFDPSSPVEALLEMLVDDAFEKIFKVGPKIIQYYDSRIKKYDGKVNYHHTPDVLVDSFSYVIESNTSGTFRKMPKDELRLILRSTVIFIERPFVEEEEFAGTKEHREMALQNMIRLLKK